jgi:hypothetical protein
MTRIAFMTFGAVGLGAPIAASRIEVASTAWSSTHPIANNREPKPTGFGHAHGLREADTANPAHVR